MKTKMRNFEGKIQTIIGILSKNEESGTLAHPGTVRLAMTLATIQQFDEWLELTNLF